MLAVGAAMRRALIALAFFGLSAALPSFALADASSSARPQTTQASKSSKKKPKRSTSKKTAKKASSKKTTSRKAATKTPARKQASRAKPSSKKRSAARTTKVPAGYRAMVRSWHELPDEKAPLTAEGRPMLVLESVNSGKRIELRPERDDGGFSAIELERAARFLADRRTGSVFPIDPRLLDLVYRIQRRFDAPLVRVISGYRMPHGSSKSNHGYGRAIDIVVPGTTDEEVASFARGMGFVGVGTYPASGFVHIDSRPKSYFWIDRSGPGRRNRTVPVHRSLAAKSDAEALARGETPPLPFSSPAPDCTAVEHAFHDRADLDLDLADDDGELMGE